MADIYDAETYEPRKGVGHLMHRVRSEMLAAVDRELAADEQLASLDVTSAQFIVMAGLGWGEMKSASDLCKGISYDAGAMTRMIDRLEEKGLVKSELGEATATRGGKRKRFYYLTGAGKASLVRAKEIRDQLWQKIPNLNLKRI